MPEVGIGNCKLSWIPTKDGFGSCSVRRGYPSREASMRENESSGRGESGILGRER